ELMFLDRYDALVPTILGFALFGLGALLQRKAPGLHTSGMQMLVWGFFVSTVALAHGTFTINSLAHVFGRRRYATGDDSRNSFTHSLPIPNRLIPKESPDARIGFHRRIGGRCGTDAPSCDNRAICAARSVRPSRGYQARAHRNRRRRRAHRVRTKYSRLRFRH